MTNLTCSVGKSCQDAETHHAFLGVQTHPQVARQDFCPLLAFRWRREDRRGKDVPRYGHGSTW